MPSTNRVRFASLTLSHVSEQLVLDGRADDIPGRFAVKAKRVVKVKPKTGREACGHSSRVPRTEGNRARRRSLRMPNKTAKYIDEASRAVRTATDRGRCYRRKRRYRGALTNSVNSAVSNSEGLALGSKQGRQMVQVPVTGRFNDRVKLATRGPANHPFG